MKVRLTPTAQRQLGQLRDAEFRCVGEVLDLLESFPMVGEAYALDSPFAEKAARYFVVRVARNTCFRITYRSVGEDVVVLYIFPATYPLTHPDHLKLHKGDKPR